MRENIAQRISNLAESPRPQQAKPLKHAEGRWRLRVGDYRILYRIEHTELTVLVVEVGHRRDVYRRR